MSERLWHKSIGGNARDAVKYGLNLKAACGLVWVPTLYENPEAHPEIGHCPACYPPRPTYVYRCFDAADRLLYVGCTRTPPARMTAHRRNTWWWPQVSRTRFLVFEDQEYALVKESEAIAGEKPLWNVRGQNYSDMPLAVLREYAAHASVMSAPDKYLTRFKRAALEYHGVQLEVAS